jgi:hypothetical protein
VEYLAIKDSTYKKDGLFKVFGKNDVLEILSLRLSPAVSSAGRIPEDYNVAGQKTLLRYKKSSQGKEKNIVEIEIRNDSPIHYRQVRFNMYSKDALHILLESKKCRSGKRLCDGVVAFGYAADILRVN